MRGNLFGRFLKCFKRALVLVLSLEVFTKEFRKSNIKFQCLMSFAIFSEAEAAHNFCRAITEGFGEVKEK